MKRRRTSEARCDRDEDTSSGDDDGDDDDDDNDEDDNTRSAWHRPIRRGRDVQWAKSSGAIRRRSLLLRDRRNGLLSALERACAGHAPFCDRLAQLVTETSTRTFWPVAATMSTLSRTMFALFAQHAPGSADGRYSERLFDELCTGPHLVALVPRRLLASSAPSAGTAGDAHTYNVHHCCDHDYFGAAVLGALEDYERTMFAVAQHTFVRAQLTDRALDTLHRLRRADERVQDAAGSLGDEILRLRKTAHEFAHALRDASPHTIGAATIHASAAADNCEDDDDEELCAEFDCAERRACLATLRPRPALQMLFVGNGGDDENTHVSAVATEAGEAVATDVDRADAAEAAVGAKAKLRMCRHCD